MKLCNETITLFNKRVENGEYVYIPTVITGVSWHSTIAASVSEKGLVAANKVSIRIPVDADCSGKTYVNPNEYKKANSVDKIFTIANGDIIIKDALAVSPMTPAQLKETYFDYCTVLNSSDDRRVANAPHFRVVGA